MDKRNSIEVSRRSALRQYPLTQEARAAELALKDGVDPRVIIGTDNHGQPIYAPVDELIELVKQLPIRSRRRPRRLW